jgi:hypothetical protein
MMLPRASRRSLGGTSPDSCVSLELTMTCWNANTKFKCDRSTLVRRPVMKGEKGEGGGGRKVLMLTIKYNVLGIFAEYQGQKR